MLKNRPENNPASSPESSEKLHYAIGLDLGGTNLKGGLVDSSGHLHIALTEPAPRNPSDFTAVTGPFLKKLGANHDIGAIGIGCKGVVDPKTTKVMFSPGDLKQLEGHSLREMMGVGAAGKSGDTTTTTRRALYLRGGWGGWGRGGPR